MTESKGLWEENADWWQREFTAGVDPEYEEQIIPLLLEHLGSPSLVVDVGSGEGQLARVVHDRTGAFVVGLDPTVAQITEAGRRGGGPCYVRAGCEALPISDDTVDSVVVCLVFEHVEDIDAALAEIARILRPGGRLLFFLNHPLLQTPESGMIFDHVLDPPETYWRIGPYLAESSNVEEVQKGVFVRFVHRPLGRYVNGLTGAGLRLLHMDEPAPPPGFVAKAHEYESEVVRSIPRLLLLVAERELDTMGAA